MTTEEKLQKFYDSTIQAANEEAEQIVTDYQKALDQLYQEHVDSKKRRGLLELEDEKEKLKRENNREISAQQLEIRRRLSVKSQELKEALFSDVEAKLTAFKGSSEYVPYLCKKIKEAMKEMPEDSSEIIFYLDESDAALQAVVSEKSGVAVRIAADHFMGGIQAVIPERHILIDNSFASMLAEERETFNPEGGMQHA